MKTRNIIIGSVLAVILIVAISFAVFNVGLPEGVKDSSYLLTGKVTKLTYQDGSSNFLVTSNEKPRGYVDVTDRGLTISELSIDDSYWTNATSSRCSLTYEDVKTNLKSSREECYDNMVDFENEYVNPETDEAGIFRTLTYLTWANNPIITSILMFFWTIFFDNNEVEDIRTCFWLLETDRFFDSAEQCEAFASGQDVGTRPTSDTGDYTLYSKAECVDMFATEPAKLLECYREAEKDDTDKPEVCYWKVGAVCEEVSCSITDVETFDTKVECETGVPPRIICSQAGQTGCVKPPVIVTGFTCEDLDCKTGRECKINATNKAPYCVDKDLNDENTFNLIWILVAFVVLLLIIVGTFALNPKKRSKGRPRKLFVKRRRR